MPVVREQLDRADLADSVASLRAVLTAVDAGELSCSAAYRNRLQGAVVALECLTRDAGGVCTPGPLESTV